MAPIAQIPRALESLLIHTLTPTRTLLTPPSLVNRQADSTVTVVTVPDNTNSDDNDPTDAQTLTGGAIAGIVIGSIAGFLLLVWIFRSCSNLGAPPGASENPGGRAWYDGVRDEHPAKHVAPVRHGGRSRSRHSHRSHRHHSRGRSRSATPVAVVRERSPRAPPYVYEYDGRRSRSRGY